MNPDNVTPQAERALPELIRVLLVEDVEDDALLMVHELQRGGFAVDHRRVEKEAALRAALAEGRWDLVLSDFQLPGFDGQRAIEAVRQSDEDVPFVLVSGAIGEDAVVNAIKAGADDYVFKNTLYMLPRTVRRAIECRRARKMARTELEERLGSLQRQVQERTRELEVLNARLSGSERFARSALDAMSARVAILDGAGTILSVNRAWREFGLAIDGAAGSVREGLNYLDTCDAATGEHAAQARAVADGIRAVMSGHESEFAMELACHLATRQCWALLRVTRFEVLGSVRVVLKHEDVTEMRLAQELLRAQSAELERARVAADSANKARGEFLAMMSHEIRTPLNGVVGTLDLIEGTPMTEQQRRYLSIGRMSATALLAVINHILDFSKIDAGQLELCPTEFDIVDLFEGAAEMMALKAAENKLELVCAIDPDLPGLVRGDAERVRQMAINLLGNAIKFTPSGTVILRVGEAPGAAQPGELRLRFSVTDSGIGIAPDRLAKLFKAFSQADASTTRKHGGTGLGLAITKQLAELMRGTIGVESEFGSGSTFWAEVVMQRIQPETSSPRETSRQGIRGMRVLVIDDVPAQGEAVAAMLRWLGCEPRVASSGRDGLSAMLEACAQGTPYSAVLVDDDLGAVNGVDVVRAMQAHQSLAAIPRVLLLRSLNFDADAIVAAGFVAHLVKPIRRRALLDAVQQAAPQTARATRSGARSPTTRDELATSLGSRKKRGLRLLLAEDNEINQVIAQEMLAKSGFECTVAADGRAAVAAVTEAPFDIVLMDCQMPEMDGFDASREIRRLEQAGKLSVQHGRRLPIIALTATATSGDCKRCLDAGMDAYATKPIDIESLRATIEGLTTVQS